VRVRTRLMVLACLVALTSPAAGRAQERAGGTAANGAPPAPPADSFGRDTPRGTVLGFLSAARAGDDRLAAQYLQTNAPQDVAERLARQLFVVLDTRLPARLSQLSAAPEGSRDNPLEPHRETVGTIDTAGGPVDIVLERVDGRHGEPAVWLFSTKTLASVPALYDGISLVSIDTILPAFLRNTRLAGVRLFEWVAVLLGLPLLYLLTVLLNRLLTPLLALGWRRVRGSRRTPRELLPMPVRLLLLAFAVRWLALTVQLPIIARQFWLTAAGLIVIAAIVWLLIVVNGRVERLVRRRFPVMTIAAATSLLRLGRRVVDVLLVFAGVLVILRYLGVDVTPALAGLGVGGIAVALAAQKTLENVIAGMSLIFDRAVSEGDFLKVGQTEGTVDHVGLRSTRIRTLDRTMVSVPNSQIGNMSLETFSARDKFWFHHVVGLRYETTAAQLRDVVDGIRRLLLASTAVEPESVRVRFMRLGAFSLDVDVFAYLSAADWNHFLELQEGLLFSVMDVVQRAGAEVAFPSQTVYVSGSAEAAAAAAHASLPVR
jgi:MscS family membrane protein